MLWDPPAPPPTGQPSAPILDAGIYTFRCRGVRDRLAVQPAWTPIWRAGVVAYFVPAVMGVVLDAKGCEVGGWLAPPYSRDGAPQRWGWLVQGATSTPFPVCDPFGFHVGSEAEDGFRDAIATHRVFRSVNKRGFPRSKRTANVDWRWSDGTRVAELYSVSNPRRVGVDDSCVLTIPTSLEFPLGLLVLLSAIRTPLLLHPKAPSGGG
jgi:hypothetical protein